MEIHLLLEGEQVGPLSEAQVRQYLDEGVVSPDDLASCQGIDDWLPLDRVLARLPPFTPAPETISPPALPAEPSPAAAADPEPDPKPDPDNSSFIMPQPAVGSFETTSLQAETSLSLTAFQKTKRKLGKIVIQPILPLETTLPAKKKSGKTSLTLEPLRSTMSLPLVAGYQPREKTTGKGTGRTGKVALRSLTEQPVIIPISEPEPPSLPTPPPDSAPPPAAVIVEPVTVLPAPAAVLAEPVALSPDAAAEPVAPVPPPESTPPPEPSPIFSVLPKDSPFMPPSIRSVGGTPATTSKPAALRYAGTALAFFILCVLIACSYLFTAHRTTAPAPNPLIPRGDISPPAQTSMQVPAAGSTTAADFRDRGMKRQAAGDLDGAIQDFDQALALDPQAVEVYFQRGLALQAKRDLPGAIADFTAVIALDPKRADAFGSRGYIKQDQLDFDGALADYALALAIDPKLPVVYDNIGLIKVKKGDLDGAIAAYGRAIDLDPQMAFAFYNRGVAKNTEGDVDGAIADYTQAIGLNPKIALAFIQRGLARQSKGDSDGASADYTQALSLDPTLTDAFYNRSLIKIQEGDFNGAVDDCNHVLTLDANYAPAFDKRGLALVGKNRPAAALSDFKQFCTLTPRDPATDTARLYIWLMATELNANGDPDADLSAALINDWNSPPEDLTSKIAAFLVGHINENALIAAAATPDPGREPGPTCRVWYFAGKKRLLDGDTATAAAYFQKSIATGQKGLNEYAFAQAELQAMNPSGPVASP